MINIIGSIHYSRFKILLVLLSNVTDNGFHTSSYVSNPVQKINPSMDSEIRWIENPYDARIYLKRNLLATISFIVTWLILSLVGIYFFTSSILTIMFLVSNLAWVALLVVSIPLLWNARAIIPVQLGISNEGLYVRYTRRLRGTAAHYQAPELIRWSGMLKVNRNADTFLKCVNIGIKIGPGRNDWAPLHGLTINLADEIIHNYETRKAPEQSI